MRKQEMVVSQS